MLTVLIKVASIFTIIIVGFVCNKLNILPSKSKPYLVSLLLTIATPCMMISSLAEKELNSESLRSTFEVLFLSIATLLFAMLISYIVVVKILKYEPKAEQGVVMAIMSSVNSGFLGFPVSKAIFGDDIFYLFIIQNIFLSIYFYSICILQMNYGSDVKLKPKEIAKSIISAPIVGTVIGIVILFSGIKLPDAVSDIVGSIGDMTVPLSMILIGMLLGEANLKSVFKNYKFMIASALSVTLIPILVFLLLNWLPLNTDTKVALTFCHCFPAASTIAALSAKEGKNANLAAEGVAVTTLMSLITLPISAMLIMNYYY